MGEAGERKQLQSGASALATIRRHTLVLLDSPLLLVSCAQAAPPWNCSPELLSWPGWRWIFSFNMVTIGRNCYHFGANFVMDCKCSMWTMWASCQFLPLLAQLDRVKHPRWSFYVGIRSFGRTAMVVAFKCFLRKRCGFACNSQTHFPSHAEQLKRHLLSVSKGGCYRKSSEEEKILLNWMQTYIIYISTGGMKMHNLDRSI